MAETFIWKPSTINSWKRGIAFLAPQEGTREPPVITTADGRTFTGRYVNTNEGRHQWVFPPELAQEQGLNVSYGGQTSTIESGAVSYEGSSLGGWQAREKGSLGSSGGTSGVPGGFEPGQVGDYGSFPAYLGGQFPQPTFATFDQIKAAPYKYTDPFEFGEKYGEFARGEMSKNFGLSKDIAMEALDTELQGLKTFAPAASALKRQETSIDNIFNQAERTRQVEGAMPGVRQELASQTGRASTYAQGRLTSDIDDRALELGMRSRAADNAYAGGFGTRSSVARKTSDLMSAEERFKIAQYGENLLGTNVQTRANLELAPTSYSDAGAQIKVTPEMSGSRLFMEGFSQAGAMTGLPAQTAFQGELNQQQFGTNIAQRTNEFNASGSYTASAFNAGIANDFAMSRFGYDTGFANSVAAASQTNINTQTEIAQQNEAKETFKENFDTAQDANTIKDIIGGLATLGGMFINRKRGTPDDRARRPSAPGTPPSGGGGGGGDVIIDDAPVDGSPGGGGADDSVVDRVPDSEPPPYDPDVGEGPDGPMPAPPEPGDVDSDDVDGRGSGEFATGSVRSLAMKFNVSPSDARALKDFSTQTGGTLCRVTPQEARDLSAGARHVMNSAGVYSRPLYGTVPAGYDTSGNPVYNDARLVTVNTTEPGLRDLRGVDVTLQPFESFTLADGERLKGMTKLMDPAFIRGLDALANSKDPDAFMRTLTNAVKNAGNVNTGRRAKRKNR